MKRNPFGNKSTSNSKPRRRPFWKRLPAFPTLSIRFQRRLRGFLRRFQLPELPPIRLYPLQKRLPQLPTPNLRFPRLPNPFQTLFIGATDYEGFFIILIWLGYTITLVSLIDYAVILYPIQLTNTSWEFQIINRIVNNAWFFLLGLILIFIPSRAKISRFELSFLKPFRWAIFLGGVLFILAIPLTLLNGNRLHQRTVTQLSQQQGNQQEQLNTLKDALEEESLSFFQLQQLRDRLNIETVPESSSVEQVLIAKIEERKQQLREENNNQKQASFRQLYGQAIRNSVASLLIGAFLIRLWWESRWVKRVK